MRGKDYCLAHAPFRITQRYIKTRPKHELLFFCMIQLITTMKKNTPQVWDNVWSDTGLVKEDVLILAAEEATIRWKRLEKVMEKEYGSIRGLNVIEIGSGIGTYAALFAKNGAKVTLLDYSPKALERAKEFFTNNRQTASYIIGDALNIPAKLKDKYDIAISVGLTEHFKGTERELINKAHLDVLKKGGLAVYIVPNKYNLPYRIFKKIYELTGRWKYGEEYPYSRGELLTLGRKFKAQNIALFGDDLYSSIKFLLPANFLRRFFGVGFPRTLQEVKQENGTPLDNYLSYSLIFVLKKL